MSTSTTDDMNDSVRGLNLCDEASKCRGVIARLSNQRGQRWVIGAHARVGRSRWIASGPRRLSMRADSVGCDETRDDHQPSKSELPSGLGHDVFLLAHGGEKRRGNLEMLKKWA